jgi:phage-related protein
MPIIAMFSMFGGIVGIVINIVNAMVLILGGPLTIALFAIIALGTVLAMAWKNNWGDIQGKVKTVVDWFQGSALPIIKSVLSIINGLVSATKDEFIGAFNSIKGAIEGVIGAIRGVISAAEGMAGRVKGGLKIPGFQHGGFVPGVFNQPIPAILHPGERVLSRTGTDVNPGSGGGGGVTLNFTGPISLDSDTRVQELADKIIRILGRQNELASKGVGF